MNIRRLTMWYLIFIPLIFAYDCEEICHIEINIIENTSIENLKWNLIDLLSNRTNSSEYFQYSLSNPSNYFELNLTILKYRLKEFDREKICKNIFLNDQCILELQIFTQTSFIILFKLIILDDNDWEPTFNQNFINLIIRENLPINYHVQLPIAYDYDSIKYNINHYEFINNTDEIEKNFQLEQIDDELRLKLLKKFDCEIKNNYQLFIIAIDKGGLKSNILHVNITVGDLNEYQPRFTQPFYHTRIPENLPIINSTSVCILQVLAIDDDCYDKIIHYSIINNEIPLNLFPFIIDKYTGFIRVKQQLDYETISTYRFHVRASNLDEITSSIVSIIIDILDINDNQPIIYLNILNEYKLNKNKENININENINLGQVIGTILIRDIDSTMINHRLSLKILSCLPLIRSCPIELDSRMENNSFNPTTYLIRISRLLNSELGDQEFTIIFEARDYGDPSLTSQYRLIINVNDVNDCAPKFTELNYQFHISNSSLSEFSFGKIQAIDNDYSLNYRHIKYEFQENNYQNIIRIDSNNGNLYLIKQPLIKIEFINLTVLAIDQDNHSLYDQTTVEILFYDETTCLPRFSQEIYIFNTTEHEIIPYEIGQVIVNHCLLLSTSITYQLIKIDSSSSLFPFSIDTNTGRIKVIGELDREIQAFYNFSINSSIYKIQTEIQINIIDKNDHYPIFDNSYEPYIYISTHHHHQNEIFITNIHATDDDIDLNGLIDYYFIDKDLYAYFHLYSNGSIILYNLININLPIRLEIYARDHGYPKALNSKENIVIYICDIYKRNECSFSRLQENVYLGSIFIMILVIGSLLVIILCIFWNLFLKKQVRNRTYNCRIEARKNLIVSDGIYDSSPTINRHHRLNYVMV